MIKNGTLLSSKDDTCLRKLSIFMGKLDSSIVPNCHAFHTSHLLSSVLIPGLFMLTVTYQRCAGRWDGSEWLGWPGGRYDCRQV